MSWTVPRTWVSGEIVTAANMNTHVRDQFTELTQVWTAYTPTWSGTTGNGVIAGRWQKVGMTVNYVASVVWGTTTSHAAARQTLTLPFAYNTNYVVNHIVGISTCYDFATNVWGGSAYVNGTGAQIEFIAEVSQTGTTSSVVNQTNPMSWGNGDQLYVTGTYERATL